jgi:hypothetical protein
MKRTDIHSETFLKPSDYEFIGFWDSRPDYPLSEFELDERRYFTNLVIKNKSSIHGLGQCAHCGSYIRYHVLYRHTPTDTYIVIGNDCSGSRFDQGDNGWKAWKSSIDAKREKSRLLGAINVWRAENALNEESFLFVMSAEATNIITRQYGKWISDFLISVHEQLTLKKKTLSEKQVEIILRTKINDEKFRATMLEQDDQLSPVVVGNGVTIEGEITKVKVVSGYTFNSPAVVKITIKDTRNFFVFGTCPTALVEHVIGYDEPTFEEAQALVGKKVKLIANTEVGDRAVFGFYKRPRKPEFV